MTSILSIKLPTISNYHSPQLHVFGKRTQRVFLHSEHTKLGLGEGGVLHGQSERQTQHLEKKIMSNQCTVAKSNPSTATQNKKCVTLHQRNGIITFLVSAGSMIPSSQSLALE